MNACDYGHDTKGEIRLVPLKVCGSVQCCRHCFDRQEYYLKHCWEDLKIFQEKFKSKTNLEFLLEDIISLNERCSEIGAGRMANLKDLARKVKEEYESGKIAQIC